MEAKKKQKRTYPEQMKRNALELVRTTGRSGSAVAQELGIKAGILNRWRREEAQEGNGTRAFSGQGIPRDEEVARLKRENDELREANDILKKAVAIFSVKGNRK